MCWHCVGVLFKTTKAGVCTYGCLIVVMAALARLWQCDKRNKGVSAKGESQINASEMTCRAVFCHTKKKGRNGPDDTSGVNDDNQKIAALQTEKNGCRQKKVIEDKGW